MTNKVETTDLTPDEYLVLCVALDTVEHIFGAKLMALYLTEERAPFFFLRPGSEVHIMRQLATTDWKIAIRLAEEHTQ